MARLESTRAQDAFARFGIYDVLPKDCIFHSVDEAMRALRGKPEAHPEVIRCEAHASADGARGR